jgi:hypothetical protein
VRMRQSTAAFSRHYALMVANRSRSKLRSQLGKRRPRGTGPCHVARRTSNGGEVGWLTYGDRPSEEPVMDVAQILTSVGSVALIVGIGVGLLQLRALARQRQEEMVLRLYAPFYDPAFQRAYWQIQRWTFASFAEFDAKATLDEVTTLDVVGTYFEMMGLLYKRGMAKLDLLDDLLASQVLIAWNKTAPLYYGFRAKENSPDWAEWFEYLAVALDKRLTALGEPHQSIPDPAALTRGVS